MVAVVLLTAYVAVAAGLVAAALRAKGLSASSRVLSFEDGEQMRAIGRSAARGRERDPLATVH